MTGPGYNYRNISLMSDDPNDSFYDSFQAGTLEPICGSRGASLFGPQNIAVDRQNPDLLDRPSTDNGAA